MVSGPPAGVENVRGCWVLFLLQQWHHSVESPRSLGRGKPAAAPAVTLGEDRRIPSCCCGMLASQICFLFFSFFFSFLFFLFFFSGRWCGGAAVAVAEQGVGLTRRGGRRGGGGG